MFWCTHTRVAAIIIKKGKESENVCFVRTSSINYSLHKNLKVLFLEFGTVYILRGWKSKVKIYKCYWTYEPVISTFNFVFVYNLPRYQTVEYVVLHVYRTSIRFIQIKISLEFLATFQKCKPRQIYVMMSTFCRLCIFGGGGGDNVTSYDKIWQADTSMWQMDKDIWMLTWIAELFLERRKD